MKSPLAKFRKRWYYLTLTEFSLILTGIIVQRVVFLPFIIMAITYYDLDSTAPSLFFDTPIFGFHPAKSLAFIIALMWILSIISAVSSWIEKHHHPVKFVILYMAIALIFKTSTELAFGMLNGTLMS